MFEAHIGLNRVEDTSLYLSEKENFTMQLQGIKNFSIEVYCDTVMYIDLMQTYQYHTLLHVWE